MPDIELSVIVPVFNEAGNILVFASELSEALEGFSFEVIFVDDGSTDESATLIKSLGIKNLQYIGFWSNAGHMAALDAGYRAAKGDYIVTLDADLQHPPKLIRNLYESSLQNKADVVYAVRDSRKNDSFFKRLTSKIYYKVLAAVSGTQIRDSAADFRLITRKALEVVNSYPAGFAVFRVLIPSLGFREAEVRYTARDRYAGKTKYSLVKMIELAIESVLTSTIKPLLLSLVSAGITAFLAVVGFVYVFIQWFESKTVVGWASLASMNLVLFAVLFFNVAVVSLYIGRISKQSGSAPTYSVREFWNNDYGS